MTILAPVACEESTACVVRPWTAFVCARPGDGSDLIVDWLSLLCADAGLRLASRLKVHDGITGYSIQINHPDDFVSNAAGPVDLLLATEQMELLRTLALGLSDPQVTTIVSSSHRELTAHERSAAAGFTLEMQEVDDLAHSVSRRYVGFDLAQVAGWYRLDRGQRGALVLGAAVGSRTIAFEPERVREAITRLGIDVERNLESFGIGLRIGRRPASRGPRSMTPAQFVRKQRDRLSRAQRPSFETLINEIAGHGFDPQLEMTVRELALVLTEYESVQYAQHAVADLVKLAAVADDRLVATAAQGMARILLRPDIAYAARICSAPKRLPLLRKRHGIERGAAYRVSDLLPLYPDEAEQLLSGWQQRFMRSADPFAQPVRYLRVTSTTLRGGLLLRSLRSAARRRAGSDLQAADRALATSYIDALVTLCEIDLELARQLARTAAIVQGAGPVRAATRLSADALWSTVTLQAAAIDRARHDREWTVTRTLVSYAQEQIGRYGLAELWRIAGAVTSHSLHMSRGGSVDASAQALLLLCGVRPAVVDEVGADAV